MTSALDNGVKGGKWFSLIDKAVRPQTLDIAWRKVAANKGAAGVDGESVERFAARSEVYLRELGESLSARTYRPSPVKRVEIPKGGGGMRPLGIPTVKDRIVQTAPRARMGMCLSRGDFGGPRCLEWVACHSCPSIPRRREGSMGVPSSRPEAAEGGGRRPAFTRGRP